MDKYRTAIFNTQEQAMAFVPIVQVAVDTLPGKVDIQPVLLNSGAYPGKWAVTLIVEPAPELLEGIMVVDTIELPVEVVE